MDKKSITDLDVSQQIGGDQVIDTVVTGNTAMTVRGAGSALQTANADFEGLDAIGNFMPYFTLDGSELLNKTSETTHKDIEVVIEGGKKIWQLWDTNSNLIAESFDGITSTSGDNMNALLMQTKAANPGDEEKIKIQSRYEIYFQWSYGEDGDKLTKISLSPASMYAFKDYATDLLKTHGLALSAAKTRISVKRTQNKQNQRYSVAVFELVGAA